MIGRLSAALALAMAASPPAAVADDVAEARERFRRGVELYRAERFGEAVAEFEAAYRFKPHGAIHFNVAQCRERLRDWPAAHRAYNDYLREIPDAKDLAAVRATLRRIGERLAATGVQALLVYSEPPGARLALDGRELGATPLQAVLPPGTYAVTLTLEGHEPFAEGVELRPEASRVLDVTLRRAPAAPASSAAGPDADLSAPEPEPSPGLGGSPPAPAPAPRTPARRLAAWVAGGTAVAAAAAGALLGWSARSDEESLSTLAAPDGAAAARYARDAQRKARAANALYALAGGAAAASATLFVLEARF